LIILVPIAFAAVLLFVYVGRQGRSLESVSHASAVAARAASMQRDIASARAAAASAAAGSLAGEGTECSGGPSVSVDASAWEPGGVVVVTVTCVAEGVGALDAGSKTFTSTSRATIDNFMGVAR
jgi:hypothetical protein